MLTKLIGNSPDMSFHKLVRLRSAKDYPLMIETTYLPTSRFIHLDTETIESGSLYDYLRKYYNFKAERIKETLRPKKENFWEYPPVLHVYFLKDTAMKTICLLNIHDL